MKFRPSFTQTIRFRLTLWYSAIVFVLGLVLVLFVYTALSRSLSDEPVTATSVSLIREGHGLFIRSQTGVLVPGHTPGVGAVVISAGDLERLLNAAVLDRLRSYSLTGLSLLFILSLGVGYFLAGRALKPVQNIMRVAQRISERNLSERINLRGPQDELRELANTFDAMIARLDNAFRQQRQFVQDASHELRTPLQIVQTNVEVTLDNPRATLEDYHRAAEVVQMATVRMARLVQDLLTLSKGEQLVTRLDEVDLGGLLAEVSLELGALAREQQVSLTVLPSPPLTVRGDAPRLKEVFINLVENALRYNQPGGAVMLRMQAMLSPEGDAVLVDVSDTGSGIPPEHLPRLFDRFYRVDGSRSRNTGGSGLGLAIAQQIISLHHGSISVWSAPGQGTRFTVRLPVG